MMLSVAMAYDFCYEAWSPEFRLRVVNEIQNYERMPVDYDKYAEGHKGLATMDVLVNPAFPPRSNHHGAYVGGAGIALLAIRNDPGADMTRIQPWLKQVEQEMIRVMTQGFGDKGFFAEGHGPSHMAANNAFVPLLQAARVSWGKDFISPRSNAPWISLRWAMEIIPHAEKAWYPNYKLNAYGSDHKWRGSMSDGGDWSQGFGALANEAQQAAMLWMYENAIEKEKPLQEFDAWTYPHRAVFAFINWPIGLEPQNPGNVLGHANADMLIGHFMFRREWKDADDVYVTFLLNKDPRRGYVRSSSGGHITIWGQGIRERVFFRCNQRARITAYDPREDGSGVMAFEMNGQHHSLAVDFGKASSAEAVVIIANPWFEAPEAFLQKRKESLSNLEKDIASGKKGDPAARMQFAYLDDGNTAFMVMNLHPKGVLPDIQQQGSQLQVGQQRYRFDGKRLFIEP